MSGDENDGRRTSAREELEEARERYHKLRQQEHDVHQPERERQRATDRAERERSRDERRSLRDEIRRTIQAGVGHDLGKHIGKTIKDSMSFNIDLGDMNVGGEEHSEIIERDFTVGATPGLHVRNVSGDTRIVGGTFGTIHVRARKRVRGTSEERAKRLLENVEVRMEQDGNEIILKPHLYEQDRGWADLFRGGRVAVDFEISVPREVRVEAHTVSGDVTLSATQGPMDVQSVSGEITLTDVQGPLRVKTVSGDGDISEFAGQLVANTVSGDLTLTSVRLYGSDVVTVSGDVSVDGELETGREHRLKTISGDVGLHLTGGSYDVRFTTMSGDLENHIDGVVSAEGSRAKRIAIGSAETMVSVKTMSGDLELRASVGTTPESSSAAAAAQPADQDRTEPMEPPPHVDAGADIRELLDRVARGDVDVATAAAQLDARRER